ncbi:hypothetical protein [Actinomadura miaoliensis]|uniref:Uncharacterized protein n=1 Tax=Actinomadura miaoliensis TaxID=430685 RepID=A0ABP7X4H8_9ACTN
MSDQMFKEAFERIADRAEPVEGLAERALRRARRRRAAMLSGAALGTAAAVAVPIALLNVGGRAGPAPRPQTAVTAPGLPSNSPAEAEVVRACMRNGPPIGPSQKPEPQLGGPADYRLLVSQKVGRETVALVGGDRGFVLCARETKRNFEPPLFHPWPNTTGKGLGSFAGEGRVDVISSLTSAAGTGRDLHHLVAGRIKPDVARVVVTWDRGRTVNATIQNGFFLARVDSRIVKTGPGAWSDRDERVLSVEGFGRDGVSRFLVKAPNKGVQAFRPGDCPSENGPSNFLCQGFVPR